MYNIIVIIQARMGSTRLPGKILRKIGEHDVLHYVVERCRQIKNVQEVIVATSTLPQDQEVEDWCKARSVKCFRGSEKDVLDRFIQCARQYQPDYVIRVTADCPFVDFRMANEMVSLLGESAVDIIDINGEVPRGLTVEVISYQALQYIDKHGKEERHREHVTYYAYEYKDSFSRISYSIPTELRHPEMRITLDTKEDYQVCHSIANFFKNPLVDSSDVMRYLLDHPNVAKINQHIEQKPVL